MPRSVDALGRLERWLSRKRRGVRFVAAGQLDGGFVVQAWMPKFGRGPGVVGMGKSLHDAIHAALDETRKRS